MSGLAGLVAAVGLALLAGCNNQRADAGAPAAADLPLAERVPTIALAPVSATALCATKGTLAPAPQAEQPGKLRIAESAVRAVALDSSGDAAALRFAYDGPTERVSRLASGQVRRQVGLKLRAEDGCNLIYVMWRVAPEPGVEVSVKRNPGSRTHRECGTGGYIEIAPSERVDVPRLRTGTSHTLQAEIIGDVLIAWIDGTPVWQGHLDPAARDLVGSAGLRTDNAELDLELLAAHPPALAPGSTPRPIPGCARDE